MIFYGGSKSHATICTREIKEMTRLQTYRPAFPDNAKAWNLKRSAASFVHDLPEERRSEHNAKIANSVREYYRKSGKVPRNRKSGTVHRNPRSMNPIRFAGRVFLTVREAAEFAKVTPTTMRRWIAKGYKDFPKYSERGIPIIWNDRKYPSTKAASEETGHPVSTLHYWIKAGFTKPPERYGKKTTWGKKTFHSIGATARSENVSPATIKNWIKNGIDEVPPNYRRNKHRKTSWRGDVFPTMQAAADFEGVPTSTMWNWKRRGLEEPPPGYRSQSRNKS